MTAPVLVLHGIWNRQRGVGREETAAAIAAKLQPRLAKGYRAAGLAHMTPPPLAAVYYADLLDRGAQAVGDIDSLSPAERELLWRWLLELGVPTDTAQGAI